MKKVLISLSIVQYLFFFLSCDIQTLGSTTSESIDSETSDDSGANGVSASDLIIDFTDGTATGYNRIYTVWMENDDVNFYQNIYICNHVVDQDLTGTLMPYWENNIRDEFSDEEIDAVSGASVTSGDITFTASLDAAPEEFTVCFEIDHSFDSNDWFDDQPSILYSIEIDTSGNETTFSSVFTGWTPNNENDISSTVSADIISAEITSDILDTINSKTEGILVSETKYITNYYDNAGGFGNTDTTSNIATKLVGGLTATVSYE
jgi:hypothetical protein